MPCARFDIKSRKSLAGEKKYYLSDLSFYYALNADNRINYGPALENIVYTYASGKDYSISVGKIGKLECDFILRDNEMNYSYVQIAYMFESAPGYEGELVIPDLLDAVPNHTADAPPAFDEIEFVGLVGMDGPGKRALVPLHDIEAVLVRDGRNLPKYFCHTLQR